MMHAIKTVKTAIIGENPENFIRYDDPSVEQIQENEEHKIGEIIESFRCMQEKNFKKHEYGLRGTHAKTQGLVKGTLTVHSNLPSYLSQGLFKHPGEYPVILRYANEPTQIKDDRTPGPRGLVATLDILKQEALDPDIARWWHDHIRLYAWAGLEEHRPLGSINRIRRRLYDASVAFRTGKNEEQVVFPQNINEIPKQTSI